MSSSVDNIFITKFIGEVAHEFQQSTSLLRGTVRNYTGVGKDFKFPRMESVTATRNKARHADVVPANIDSDQVTATFIDVHAAEYIDNFDQLKTNVELRKNYAEILTNAVNRELDAIIIEALNQSANTELSISNTLNAAGLITANEALTVASVPQDGGRFAVISPGGQTDILSDNKLTSRDYVTSAMLQDGFAKGVLGFNLVTSTLLPAGTGGSQTRNFFYHKNAVGLAIASDLKMEVNYIPQKLSWLVAVTLSAASTIVRPEGVQRASISN